MEINEISGAVAEAAMKVQKKVGLLINFVSEHLRDGITQLIL